MTIDLRSFKTLGFDSSGDLTTVADFLPAGGDSAMFQYSTTTSDADPGAGKFRLNHATISSATEMYIDDLEFNGTDVSAWVQSWDDVTGNDTNRGRIRISKANTLDTWMVFKVTGAITDASGYSKISLVYIDTAGTFANDDKVFISFVASGEDGAIPGYFYKFDTGTSDTDPGAGEIAFNNGTYASATEIYIDDADAMTAVDVMPGSLLADLDGTLSFSQVNGEIIVLWFSLTGDYIPAGSEGHLFTVDFTVDDDAPNVTWCWPSFPIGERVSPAVVVSLASLTIAVLRVVAE